MTASVVDNLEQQSSQYSDATAYSGTYTEYRVEARYDRNWGKIACPVAGPKSSPPEILTLAAPMKKVQFSWSVERNATVPNVPDSSLSDPTLTLLSDSIRPCEVLLAPDGQTPVYRIEGVYEYVQNTDASVPATLSFPTVPWTNFAYGTSQVGELNYQHGIIDGAGASPVQPPGGGGNPGQST